MNASWIFKPRYNQEICERLINRFATKYLDWHEQGIAWYIAEIKKGWFELQCVMDEPGRMNYWSDTCLVDNRLTADDLANCMMVLLVEAGLARNCKFDLNDHDEYSIEDVDMTQVLSVLCRQGTNIYSPWGSKCWVYPVGGGTPKTVDMLDALLTLKLS